jgi:hypothetical protein
MTDKKEAFGPTPISASDLRMRMAEREMEDSEKAMAKRKEMEAEQEEFRKYFMSSEVTDNDRQRIRQRALQLAEQGQTEICILSFPSDFCSDGGRAINNNLPDWTNTLTGRAEKLYALWEQNAKPMGYKLEARVLNYPNGIIGDIGLYVTW